MNVLTIPIIKNNISTITFKIFKDIGSFKHKLLSHKQSKTQFSYPRVINLTTKNFYFYEQQKFFVLKNIFDVLEDSV